MWIADIPTPNNLAQDTLAAYRSFQLAAETFYQDVLKVTGVQMSASAFLDYIHRSNAGGITGTIASVTSGFNVPITGDAATNLRFTAELEAAVHAENVFEAVAQSHEGGSDLLGILPLVILGGGALALALGGASVGAAGAAAGSSGSVSGAVGGALTGAEQAAGAAAGAITGAQAGVAAGAGAAAGTAAAAAGSAAGGAAAAGAAAAGLGASLEDVLSGISKEISGLGSSASSSGILSDIFGGVSDLFKNIGDFLSPLVDFAKNIFSAIEDINNNIIKPLSDTVLKDYQIITGLIGEVHTLAQSGIMGILAIPDALSKAFTSLDASNLRLAQVSGDINKGIANDVLVPGIGTKLHEPLANIHEVLSGAFNKPVPDIGSLPHISLTENAIDLVEVEKRANDAAEALSQVPVLGPALSVVLKSINVFLASVASVEHTIEAVNEAAWVLNPDKRLDPQTVVSAWWKGLLDEKTARSEIQRAGIDQDRQTVLYDLQRWLPSLKDAINLYYRHIIDGKELQDSLTKQGMMPEDIEAMVELTLDPINPREAIDADGKLAAAQAGFLQQTLTQKAPEQYSSLYAPKLADPEIANYDWLEHWQIPDMSWWLQAYYKGIASKEEVELAAQAKNIPPEVIPNLIAVDQRQLSLYLIVQILDLGVLQEQEARDYLAYLGAAPRDIDILIRYSQAKAAGALPNDPLGLGKLSEGQARMMFYDGIINESEYVEIIEAHGYTPQAAALMKDLIVQERDLEERKSHANSLIQQVLNGQISAQDMQSDLGAHGYTSIEISKYMAALQEKQAVLYKVPSKADIEAFFKHGVIDDQTAIAALQVDGWNITFANAFIQLWSKASGTSTTSSGTTTPGS